MPKNHDHSSHPTDDALPAWYTTSGNAFPMYEHLSSQGFPTVKQLHDGILLGCLGYALWQAITRGQGAGCDWDADTYIDDNEQGERWSVTFRPEGAVAVFYSSESKRNPFPKESPPYELERFFQGMPAALQTAKERALSYMINLDWEMGGPNAAITSAMWASGEQFTANESWDTVFHESAWACYQQLLPLAVALVEWRKHFSLNDDEVAVLLSLYQSRLSSKEPMVRALPKDRDAILRRCEGSLPASWWGVPTLTAAREAIPASDGIAAVRQALASVGIALD